MDGSFNDKVENKPKKEPLSYLKILHLPSFQDKRKIRDNEETSNLLSNQENEKNKKKEIALTIKTPSFTQSKNTKQKDKIKYDYPVNIFKKMFFIWSRKVLKAANSHQKLDISHLGTFSPELYPDNFLREIKIQWEEMIKKTKSSPLIKVLLKGNARRLLLVFSGSLAVVFFDSIDVMFYSQVVSNLDNSKEDVPKMSLSTSMIFLLSNYFLYAITFRSLEAYTAIFSFKLISQLDALIYDKLLRISPYNNISEGSLVNFIQSDAENFGEFFTYTPATLVQPLEIFYFLYLLFSYFGYVFIFAIITLIIIFIIFAKLEKIKAKYQKEMLTKKDRRMTTTTQAFEMITILKLYSWEDYFLNKITKEREEELIYIKKAQIVSLFIDCITWSIGPILSFVAVFSYNLFYEPMPLPKLLTSLYIFHNLTDPLFLIPEYVNGLIDSLLSLRRLEAFLFSKEYVPSQLVNMDNIHLHSSDIINNPVKKILRKENKKLSIDSDNEHNYLKELDELVVKTKENYVNKKDKEIMIEIDNLDFGIIKREEEFMIIEENEDDEEDDDDDPKIDEEECHMNKKIHEESNNKISKDKKLNSPEKKGDQKLSDAHIKGEVEKNIKIQEKIEGTVIVPLLKEIKLKIFKGNLIGIIGEFGSGKSSLFNAILNNLDILNGNDKKIFLNGSVAYVPQKPWILNETLRNNIIFNKPYDEKKYNTIIDICQLQPDFELLQEGDLTSISDKGDNLSGGQKMRLSIARAVYSDADIYLFDDPLSALDADVGKLIFQKIIKEYLIGKTVLLITHSLQYIPKMDYVIKMDEGKIVFCGNVKDAQEQDFYKDFFSSNQKKDFEEDIINNFSKNEILNSEIDSQNDDSGKFLYDISCSDAQSLILSKKDKYEDHKPSIIEVLKIVFSYSGGFIALFFVLLGNLLWKICDSGSDFIITKWSDTKYAKEKNLFIYYLLTKLLSIIFVFGKSYLIVYALITFNKNIHITLLNRLLRAPINLFHNIVSKSHIINRFSKDIGNSIKYFWSLNSIIVVLFHITNGLFIASFLFWKIIFIIPILIFSDYFLYKYYIKSAKGLNLLEIQTRIGILSEVKETLSGITSIRAYEVKDFFQNQYHKRLHDFYRVLVYQVGCSSWFALNIDLISFLFLFCILIFIWFFKNIIGGGPLGLVLNYILKLIEHSYNFFDHLNKNERMSTSMASCDKYTHIVQEAPLEYKSDEMLIKNNFPKYGKVEFIHYSVRYRPDTKIVLKDINLLIKPKEKIGIVGRTGSGKSTLCLCLLRILEATNGKILIDDVDIAKIGLSLLRRIITIIPQDPTLIEGTLRDNLDPLGSFDDQSMIDILKSIGMDYILKENGLNFLVKENGDNLSAGERQLICIARAMIRKNKIIMMDEITSNIDYDTELLIQKAISTTLKDNTVITIAHRIKTILDYDRILVFDQGSIVEEGSPKDLIEKKGHFFNLFSHSMI